MNWLGISSLGDINYVAGGVTKHSLTKIVGFIILKCIFHQILEA